MRKVMNENLRKKVLFGLLAGTIAMTAFTFIQEDQSEGIVVEATNSSQPKLAQPRSLINIEDLNSANRLVSARSFYKPSIDIFSGIQPATAEPQATNVSVKVEDSQIKTVDVQPQVIAPAPTPIPAPPPFKFIGKLYGDDEYIVFLNYNGKSIAVRTGEVLFERYKVEEIKPPTMTLVNLPLSSKETISIGEP
jgi:hypothetical protein